MPEWKATTKEQAEEIAALVSQFGTGLTCVDVGTGSKMIIARELLGKGHKNIMAWDMPDVVNGINHIPIGVGLSSHDATQTFDKEVDVFIVPSIFDEFDILETVLSVQEPTIGFIIYRVSVELEQKLTRSGNIPEFITKREGDHLVLRPSGLD
jgi:hypothetical protein